MERTAFVGYFKLFTSKHLFKFLDQNNFVWFVGGGYALSEATKTSHLAEWIGHQLIGLDVLPPFVIMMLSCLITTSFTEVSSNTATAAIFLPVLEKLVISSFKFTSFCNKILKTKNFFLHLRPRLLEAMHSI